MSADRAKLKALLLAEREWLFSWHSPVAVLEKWDEFGALLRSDFPLLRDALVTHRDAKGLREMWVLAKSAGTMNVEEIRLSANDPPDAFLRRENVVVPVEVSEILEPGRKRNLEFGPDAPAISMDPGHKWVCRADAIPGALDAGITAKKAKPNPVGTELFIYLNIDEYGIRQKEIESTIRALLALPTAPFAAINVRWKEKVFCSSGETYVDRNVFVEPEFDDLALWREVFESETQ